MVTSGTLQSTESTTHYQATILIVHCLLLCHLSKRPSFSDPAVMAAFLDNTHPVTEEGIPEIFCQSGDSFDVPFMLNVSLGCNPFVERFRLFRDGSEITERELTLVGRGSLWLLTRIIWPTARVGALSRRHFSVYPTVP